MKMECIKFMQQAIEKAKEGIAKGQAPFGACIVKDGVVLSCEHNVVWAEMDITAHAEINAIRVACKKVGSIDLSGCIIYATCEPCPMCFAAAHWARISNIVYGASIADAASAGFHELRISNDVMKKEGGSSIEIVKDFLKEESLVLFEMWKSRQGKSY